MYKTLTLFLKQAKSRSGSSLVSKVARGFLSKKSENTKFKSFVSSTGRTFAVGEHKFEKISERGSSAPKQGKFNLRSTMMSEPVMNFMTFLQENGPNMNDADYMDAFYILATRIENDSYKRLNLVGLEKTMGFQQLKKYIISNFERLLGDNYSLQNVVFLLSQFNLRNRSAALFTNEQSRKIVDTVAANLEVNHSKMSLGALLNVITIIGTSKQVPAQEYLRNRTAEEVSTLGFGTINRVLKRCVSDRMNDFSRETISKLLIAELLNLASAEKMINKCRAFNTVAKLEAINPFSSYGRGKLVLLLKDIRSQAENHDQQSILLMIEALVHFDDLTRNATLKEFYDIVTMTIKHQPENVKIDFVVRFVEQIVQLKADNNLTQEHIKTIFDYVITAIDSASEGDRTKRLPMAFQFVPFFNLMKKGKYYDKETTEKILNYIAPFLSKMNGTVDIKSLKSVVHKVFGDTYLEELESRIIDEIAIEFESRTDMNATNILNFVGRVGRFANKNNANAQKLFDSIFERLDSVINESFNFILFLSKYVKEVHDFLPLAQKLQMTDRVLKRVVADDVHLYRNPVELMVYLSQLATVEEGENRTKLNELITSVSNDARFRKQVVPFLFRICKDKETKINNTVLYKFVHFLREASKDTAFVLETPKFFDKVITSCFFLCYNLDRDSQYTYEGISALVNVTDYIHSKNPEIVVDFFRNKIPTMLKSFDKARINSQVLNKALPNFLLNSREFDKGYISNETIMVFDKMLNRSEVSENDIREILAKHIPNEEKAESLIQSTNSISTKISLIKFYANLNKKRYEVISDEYLTKLRNYLIDDIIKGEQTDIAKLQAIFAFVQFKPSIVDYNNETKEWNQNIKDVMSTVGIKKVFTFVQGLPNNKGSKFIRRLYGEFAACFEKETVQDKFFLMKVVDKFTNFGWTYSSFYNKVITDYEGIFEFYNSADHAQLINYFARVELNKEDVIRASLKNINIKQLNETGRFDLFNDLVKLGFTSQEWKELILEKLVHTTDFGFAVTKANFREKIAFLFNLWKLESWPSNNAELTDLAIESLKKKPKNLEKTRQFEDDFIVELRRHPKFVNLDPEIQSAYDTLFKSKIEFDKKRIVNFALVEYLKAMGYSNLEFLPADKLCDVFLPDTKQAIIIVGKSLLSLANNELSSTGMFYVENLKTQGLTPIIINYNTFSAFAFKELNHEEAVKYLESLNIVNNNKDNMDFTSVDSYSKVRQERTPKKTVEEEEQ